MDEQQIFNTVATHLFTQGEMSVAGNTCAYRTEDGKKCAIGCLIPDEAYRPNMEETDVCELLNKWADAPEWFYDNKRLLQDLQDTHDDAFAWTSTAAMKRSLKVVADDYDLKTTVLDTLSFQGR